jgi:hypothetical protein
MKKVWNKPELRRLVAGGAEATGNGAVPDGSTTPGGNNFRRS